MYGLIWLTQIPSKVQDCDVLVMLTSALCHDLDHPGYNNAYQVINFGSFVVDSSTLFNSTLVHR